MFGAAAHILLINRGGYPNSWLYLQSLQAVDVVVELIRVVEVGEVGFGVGEIVRTEVMNIDRIDENGCVCFLFVCHVVVHEYLYLQHSSNILYIALPHLLCIIIQTGLYVSSTPVSSSYFILPSYIVERNFLVVCVLIMFYEVSHWWRVPIHRLHVLYARLQSNKVDFDVFRHFNLTLAVKLSLTLDRSVTHVYFKLLFISSN